MIRASSLALALLFSSSLLYSLAAQEPIRLARTPDVSPDGKLVAFSYLGDIWVVETIGGTARPVTAHTAHDIHPVFSPDGRSLAFSSNRHGSYDVYVVSVHGGRPRRLAFDSDTDMVCGWSPDGKNVLFASTRETSFPHGYSLYTIPAAGGAARRLSAAEGKQGAFSPNGEQIAYVRGPGTWYRKGYRGSSNDDIWICSADGTHNRQLTSFNGQDSAPMWSADGQTVYYVSEVFGTPANVVALPVSTTLSTTPDGKKVASTKPRQVTSHHEDGVRHARISANGEWIVYECGADLWVVSTKPDSKPRKIAIQAYADDKDNPEEIKTFTNGATEFSITRDEKYIAFAVQGKLFRMPILPGAKVTQMTDGASNDHNVTWAPDNSRIVFISDRGGHEDLYLLEADDPEHPKLVDAHHFKITQLTHAPEPEQGVMFSPDGKWISFLRSGKLWLMKPDGKDAKVVVPDVEVFDYDWSPDSRWIVYARRDGSFASELYIVPAAGPTKENPARNVTRYATTNMDVTWSQDGRKIAFLSDRRGPANVFVLSLHKPAAPGVSESTSTLTIDWEDLHLRANGLPAAATTVAISPDSSKVAFRSARDGDLWVASTTGGQLTRLTVGGLQPHQLTWARSRLRGGSLDILLFLDGGGNIRMVRTGSGEGRPGNPEVATLGFKIKMTVHREDLYREMFDQTWRYLADHFYDRTFHGSDWNAVREKYRPLVSHVACREDLYSLLYLMMGELNASHLGVGGFGTAADETTADLGLIFDETYRGKGLKVAEILKRGPADKHGMRIKPGDFVLAVEGVEIGENTDVPRLLNGKVGELISLQVAGSATTPAKERRRIEIQAADRGQIRSLMYDRWVERNARRVAELSGGKLGYIHIPDMQESGLDTFVRSLYSDNFDKEAIVLDVRYNGGGFTHEQVLNYLGSREHTIFRQRDGGEGLVLRSHDRKWTRPLILLINNHSFSDAEIFPHAFRTLGLGKLVGEPTGGFVIGTGSVRLIDGSMLRLPRIGVFTTRGVDMEKEGVQPDVLVEPHPDEVARGNDAQLDRAVAVLQQDVLAWKKQQPGKAGSPVTSQPPGSGKTGGGAGLPTPTPPAAKPSGSPR
jgi:tricorn protease